jgi:hypothetical protein
MMGRQVVRDGPARTLAVEVGMRALLQTGMADTARLLQRRIVMRTGKPRRKSFDAGAGEEYKS